MVNTDLLAKRMKTTKEKDDRSKNMSKSNDDGNEMMSLVEPEASNEEKDSTSVEEDDEDTARMYREASTWTQEEKTRFEEGLDRFTEGGAKSKRWAMIASHIGSRTKQEVKRYAKVYLQRLLEKSRSEDKEELSTPVKTRTTTTKKRPDSRSGFARASRLNSIPDVDERSLDINEKTWSYNEDTLFELALAQLVKHCPMLEPQARWQMISMLLPDRSIEEIEDRFAKLVEDVRTIENGTNVAVTYVHQERDRSSGYKSSATDLVSNDKWLKQLKMMTENASNMVR